MARNALHGSAAVCIAVVATCSTGELIAVDRQELIVSGMSLFIGSYHAYHEAVK